MREIKFRVWSKKEKKMYLVTDLTFWVGIKIIGLGASLLQKRLGWEEDFEFMQFTGLLDKNGKEIYEGDIIVTKNDSCYPVIFKKGCFTCFMDDWEDYKVIGSIYENPELLKK